MRPRALFFLLTGAGIAWPLAVRGQPSKTPRALVVAANEVVE